MTPADLIDAGMMTVDETADFLAVSKSAVWTLMARRELAFTHIGRLRRIPRSAVRALVLKGLVTR